MFVLQRTFIKRLLGARQTGTRSLEWGRRAGLLLRGTHLPSQMRPDAPARRRGGGGPRTRPSGSSWARLPPTRVSEGRGFNRGEMNKSIPPWRRLHPSRRGRGTAPPNQRGDNAGAEGAWGLGGLQGRSGGCVGAEGPREILEVPGDVRG